MSKKFAVILSGCGSMDGSEIHESTLALYAISKLGGEYSIFAPDEDSFDVINHITKQPHNETRNILVESARIARGNIAPLKDLDISKFDILLFPGGFGTAKNLFTYAYEGIAFQVRDDIAKIVAEFHKTHKPICAMCIAPLMLAKLFKNSDVTITLGPDSELTETAKKEFNINIQSVAPDNICIDKINKIVTTPAYMYGDNKISNVGDGALRMVSAALELL